MSKKMKKNIISIVAIVIMLGFVAYSRMGNSHEHIPYRDFLNKVESGQVTTVFLNVHSGTISFTDEKGTIFTSENPRVNGFKEMLLLEGIRVVDTTADFTQTNIMGDIIRIAIYICAIYFIAQIVMKQMTKKGPGSQKIMKIGSGDDIPEVTFNDVIINEDIKEDISTVVDYLKNPKKYKDIGISLPKGIIFYGPPGTGKTLMAKAIAGEAGVPFIYANGSDFMQMYVGVGAHRIRELFKEARKNSPSIVFIDEIDAVGTKRGGESHGEKDQTINALLSELDGFKSNDNIVVIVATNRIKDLDDALIRPGRFDKHIAIPLPELEERKEILKIYLDKKNIHKAIDEDNWAKLTTGFSGASIATLINEGALNAIKFQKQSLTDEDMYEAYYKMVLKGHKKKNKRRDEELRIVAYHEAGHALVTKLLTKKSVPKVSIISNTSGAGGVTFVTEDNINLMSKNDLINEVKILYGGNVAEELLLGHKDETTTGASNDIERATFILKSVMTHFGMGKFGLINTDVFNLDQREVLNECVTLADEARQETHSLLLANRDKLDKIAQRLLEKENINEEELDEIINSSL